MLPGLSLSGPGSDQAAAFRDRLDEMIRSIRKALLLLPVLAVAVTARAQFSVYGALSAEKMGGISSSPILSTLTPAACTSGVTTNCTSYGRQVVPLGGTFGVSYDIRKFGPALLSADARAVIATSKQGAQSDAEGSGTHLYSYLGGVKLSFHTPISVVRPYVQGSAGYGRSNYGVLTNAAHNGTSYPGSPTFPAYPTQNNLEYHAFAGVDLRFLSFADWRVVELGYGALHSLGTYAHSYPLYSLSSGIVLHFPPRQ